MAEKEVLVKVEGVSKKFSKDLKTGLKYGLQDLFTNVLGGGRSDQLRPKEFWAVQDISFELRRGECLGLIGHNGAGKSTLLKMLNGLIRPDVGKITMKGRIGALIELGAGFNNILTGRENIYNNGAVLGLTKEEIDSKLEEIISFAELHDFIDMPVQHYSSGMKVRLGFAVAAQLNPDVLIIDEVLAVGDLGFVLKCFKTIDSILPNTAIVFVSHSMPMVSRICTHIMLMEMGKPMYHSNDVGKGIDLYYQRFTESDKNIVYDDGSLSFLSAEVLQEDNEKTVPPQVHWGGDLKLKFRFENKALKEVPKFFISIYDKEQRPVALLKPNDNDAEIKLNDTGIEFIVIHHNIQLSKGIYSVNVSIGKMANEEPIFRMNNIVTFQLIDKTQVWPPFLLNSKYLN